jgi:hypothetical protein
MSGIDREITLDRRHLAKHLPNTPQSNRLLQRGRSAHIFNDEDTLFRVAQLSLSKVPTQVLPEATIVMD